MVWNVVRRYIVLKVVGSKCRALRDGDYPGAPNACGLRIDVDIKTARRRRVIASVDDLYEPIHIGFCSTDIVYVVRNASINFKDCATRV